MHAHPTRNVNPTQSSPSQSRGHDPRPPTALPIYSLSSNGSSGRYVSLRRCITNQPPARRRQRAGLGKLTSSSFCFSRCSIVSLTKRCVSSRSSMMNSLWWVLSMCTRMDLMAGSHSTSTPVFWGCFVSWEEAGRRGGMRRRELTPDGLDHLGRLLFVVVDKGSEMVGMWSGWLLSELLMSEVDG